MVLKENSLDASTFLVYLGLAYIILTPAKALSKASYKVSKAYGAAERVFQIIDDILDITGDEKKLGKDIGSDLNKSKATYPALYGLEESRRKAEELIQESVASLEEFDDRADPLRDIARFFVNRTF